MRILGIDEAGRGPCIGPMVMCGYLVEEGNVAELKKLGVKDSKLLSPQAREKMAPKLEKLAEDIILLKIPASKIDELRSVTNLNKLEIERMQELINVMEPDKAIIDAPEANTKKFREKILCKLKNKKLHLITENFADKNYPEVSAASVIAKVCRDNEIRKLQKVHGDFGSGYPSDPRTIKFLKDWTKENKHLPDFVRKSWLTIQWIVSENEQKKLDGFW